MRSNLFWLNDEQWQRIEPQLPTDVRGKDRVDDRRVISGILHVLKSGCRWCDCPPEYGPPTTIYNRFVRWAERGVWEKLFRELAARGRSTQTQMIDSTHIKAHRSASGGKRMARPVGKWFVLSGLSSLRKRIRPFSIELLAKMEIRASWSS
jgi:transposase